MSTAQGGKIALRPRFPALDTGYWHSKALSALNMMP